VADFARSLLRSCFDDLRSRSAHAPLDFLNPAYRVAPLKSFSARPAPFSAPLTYTACGTPLKFFYGTLEYFHVR